MTAIGMTSRGPVARFEDDHGCFGRPQAGEGVELRIDGGPALPQPVTLRTRGRASTDRARMLAGQPNDSLGVRFQVEPPGWMTLIPAVHRPISARWPAIRRPTPPIGTGPRRHGRRAR